MLSYEDFAQSPAGRFVHQQALAQLPAMELLGLQGKPAIAALDAAVAAAFPDLQDTERQHCGRIVRDVLVARGWRTDRQKRVAGWKLFRSGTVYVPRESPPPAPAQGAGSNMRGEDMIDAARRLLAAARRNPDQPAGTVDDFLAERRQLWGEA